MTAGGRSVDGGGAAAVDPWDSICAIRHLDVGPVRIEPSRVVAPYTITTGSGSDTIDFIYRFEQPVFETANGAAYNLASMMAAQIALNYGLFADEIRFHGTYDDADRQFLRDMAENTAREIVVKKFLEPNPFLVGRARNLPPVKRDRYCRARLRFVKAPRSPERRTAGDSGPWSNDPQVCAILSSGGKESLLTLGIMREIGFRSHPIFINESGRHWLTALNGYRHLAATHPDTSRVWTNSDRVFSWFLRHLPFVRQDFQNVRSDEYPIRLWTVAVFLFGALPLMRHRGVGRLLIGDEFDTSRRMFHQGIAHYDGLYDQSSYFDSALTRYFQRKGYQVEQFSILRNLSEMLVQKTLAERYPDLFEHQVSCHAAHQEGNRVRPCGRCEKCRRIVAMLTVFQIDPRKCGYSESQVAQCLDAVGVRGVHQESEGAQHLAYLLAQRGILGSSGDGLPAPLPRPEVLKLRFDRDKSPASTIPPDVRKAIFHILLEHADGAVRRDGKAWSESDPISDEVA